MKKNHITICISRENYDKMLNMGDMTTSFNDIVTNLLNMAALNKLKEKNKKGVWTPGQASKQPQGQDNNNHLGKGGIII